MAENEKETKKVSVDISKFFTKEHSEKGVWFEPDVDGKIGIEFLVIGAESNEAAGYLADYDKAIDKINSEDDPKVRNEQTRAALATVTAKLVKNLRPAAGIDEIKINGKPLTYSHDLVYEIMYNSVTIADRIIRFSRKDSGFMEKK